MLKKKTKIYIVKAIDPNDKLYFIKFILKKYYNINDYNIFYNKYGKPYIDCDLYINWSDSKDYIALAISYDEIGIDIETKDIVSLGFYKIGMPLRYLFYIKKDIDINDVKIQEEEVESVKYMDELEIIELINQGKFLESHALLFKELMNKKTSLI